MNLSFTTFSLIVLTVLSLIAGVLAMAWLVFPQTDRRLHHALRVLVPTIASLTAGLFVYRLLVIHQSWQALESHVDGLILINVLVAVTLSFLQIRRRLESISAFVLPILTLLMAWAICASYWTFESFSIGSVWTTVHRLGVYLGSVFYLVAAGCGIMFLYVRLQLRRKRTPLLGDRLPSLEAVEQLLIQTATLGFALITLGLVTGVIISVSGPTALGDGWWYSPKVILATIAWITYAIVMNVRYTQTFRGSRAAWLSIAGLVFVLATFVAALMNTQHATDGETPDARTQEIVTPSASAPAEEAD